MKTTTKIFMSTMASFALLTTSALAETGSSLDNFVEVINSDAGLEQNVTPENLVAGSEAVETLNAILVEAIQATGVANLGDITYAGLKEVLSYIQTNHYDEWMRAYGSETWGKTGKRRNTKWFVISGSETGFHTVNNNGADSELMTVASTIYALFEANDQTRLDSVKKGGHKRKIQAEITRRRINALNTLNSYLTSEDKVALKSTADVDNGDNTPGNFTSNTDFYQTLELTGTGLDIVIDKLRTDEGLYRRITASMMNEGMDGANKLNHLLVEAIKATGAADDGAFIPGSLIDIDAYIRDNRFDYMQKIHGSEKKNTGWHAVVDTGSRATWTDGATVDTSKGEAFIDTRMDSLYHFGFGFRKNRIMNEAGTPLGNVHIRTLTQWMNEMLSEEDIKSLHSGAEPLGNLYTGTNLDRLIEIMIKDKPSYITTGRNYFMNAVKSAHKMNLLLLHAMDVLDIDMQSDISYGQIKEMADYLSTNFGGEWAKHKRNVQGMLGKPRLQFTSIPGVGGSGATVGSIYAIGMGVTGRGKRNLGNGPKIWQAQNALNAILHIDELPEATFNFSHPREKYAHETVNYNGVFEKAMEATSQEEVQKKIDDYISSIADPDQELVTNGSFESHSSLRKKYRKKSIVFVTANNWSGTAEVWRKGAGKSATQGRNKLELDVRDGVDSLSQTITTFSGRSYNFSLDAYAHTEGTSDIEFLVDGEVISTITPTEDWENYSVQFIGKGGQQTIEIREVADQNDGVGAIIDNVSVKLSVD